MKLEFEIPMKAETLNDRLRKHPMVQHREKSAERRAVDTLMPRALLRPLVRVTVIRLGPRRLDSHDNLRGALKSYVDAVAKAMRLDDASPLVEWAYDQEPAREYSVRFVVEAVGELPPDTRPSPKPWQLPPAPLEKPLPPPRPRAKRPAAQIGAKDLRALATPASYPAGRKP